MTAPAGKLPTCRSCGAAFTWGNIEKTGRLIPVEREPHPKGNIRWEPDRWRCTVLSGVALEAARENGVPLHRTHFVACPGAAEHRRAR